MIFNNLSFKKDKKDNDIDKKVPRVFQSKLIFNRYSLKYLIEKSDIGQVYLGTNKIDGKDYNFVERLYRNSIETITGKVAEINVKKIFQKIFFKIFHVIMKVLKK